jgi:hypothetical protein
MNEPDTIYTAEEIKYRVAGSQDDLDGRESKYESLVRAGSPFAEHYRAGYESGEQIGEELREEAAQRRGQ